MLKRVELIGFKSFAKKTTLNFSARTTAIVGPNGSGKSNVAEAFRFALGEQSIKSMRGKRSEDLIFSGSHSMARANRAAVTIVFDNGAAAGRPRAFPSIDFDEVSIERAIFRDGASEYLINGTRVRLRDVQELLARANIGDTGHHIISQGEADRILRASPRDRRAMLEDALGLKTYEFRKQEALRKLEKTEQNVREVEGLRREITPHIKFLKRQVERLLRAQSLVTELREACLTYFPHEAYYLEHEQERIEKVKEQATRERDEATQLLAAFDEKARRDDEGLKRSERIRSAERAQEQILRERGELSRELGRVEGSLESAKRRIAHDARGDGVITIPREDVRMLVDEVTRYADVPEQTDVPRLQTLIRTIATMVRAFGDRYGRASDTYLSEEEQSAHALTGEREALLVKDEALAKRYDEAKNEVQRAREAAIAYEETGREERQRLLGHAERKGEAERALAGVAGDQRALRLAQEEFTRDQAEALALAGSSAVTYEPLAASGMQGGDMQRSVQEDRKRALERLKIRVEEAGGGSDEVQKEYDDAVAREVFLEKEIDDLTRSAVGLKELITSLDQELSQTFATGLAQVNTSFGEFFMHMFGGGNAKLVLEETGALAGGDDSDEDTDETAPALRAGNDKPGIDVIINLPKKRVQALMQLSGGERALTSIALIFAMSQVNPPPFLILDETDAALDEANSRRYGDMIDLLAKRSQLIVISHNRETMSRAGMLYGVTMAGDGMSKLLSIQFEEATVLAK